MKANPKKGKGERFFDCPHYESCLNFAAVQNWKAFNCESCGFYIDNIKENTRLCEDCKKKETISPKHPLCAGCMAIRSNKSKPQKKGDTRGKNKAEKAQQRGDMELTICFGKYASLLTEIEKLADEEIRSIDEQIIFILKNYLKGVK